MIRSRTVSPVGPKSEAVPNDPHPLLIGLRAARANLIPGLCLQTLVLATLYTYYCVPTARPWFDCLGGLKRDGGYLFSVLAAMFAGAALPEMFRFVVLRRYLPAGRRAGNLLFAAVFWGINGFTVDLLYRSQNVWFGAAATVPVMAKKVMVDQFLYNPIFAAPFAAWSYEWKNRGYDVRGMREVFTGQFYLRRILPTLVAVWLIWIPVVTVTYSLPALLQTPLFSMALSFWALLLAYIQSESSTEAS